MKSRVIPKIRDTHAGYRAALTTGALGVQTHEKHSVVLRTARCPSFISGGGQCLR